MTPVGKLHVHRDAEELAVKKTTSTKINQNNEIQLNLKVSVNRKPVKMKFV